ncbi:MAG: DUF2891 family protein [Jatrophihabitantaceae bacterium]
MQPHSREWAEVVLRVLAVEYPHKSGHLTRSADDVDVTPARLFPAFHGCLDWHSSVHMQWSLIGLLPALDAPLAARASAVLDARLTIDNVAAEVAYLRRAPGFERPYGWAWAGQLAAAARESSAPSAPAWATALAPLVEVVAEAALGWLPRLAYPVRYGMHSNTAFGLLLMHEAFGALGRDDVVAAIAQHATRFFAADADYPVRWEPSGSDFLSPALCEAALMQRVLEPAGFEPWLDRFAPDLQLQRCTLFDVPVVLDRADGQAVHLVGLALSRAWLLRLLAGGRDDAAADRWRSAADVLAASAQAQIIDGDFMATHWLVSFALLAESAAAKG